MKLSLNSKHFLCQRYYFLPPLSNWKKDLKWNPSKVVEKRITKVFSQHNVWVWRIEKCVAHLLLRCFIADNCFLIKQNNFLMSKVFNCLSFRGSAKVPPILLFLFIRNWFSHSTSFDTWVSWARVTSSERRWRFIVLWALPVVFIYGL